MPYFTKYKHNKRLIQRDSPSLRFSHIDNQPNDAKLHAIWLIIPYFQSLLRLDRLRRIRPGRLHRLPENSAKGDDR